MSQSVVVLLPAPRDHEKNRAAGQKRSHSAANSSASFHPPQTPARQCPTPAAGACGIAAEEPAPEPAAPGPAAPGPAAPDLAASKPTAPEEFPEPDNEIESYRMQVTQKMRTLTSNLKALIDKYGEGIGQRQHEELQLSLLTEVQPKTEGIERNLHAIEKAWHWNEQFAGLVTGPWAELARRALTASQAEAAAQDDATADGLEAAGFDNEGGVGVAAPADEEETRAADRAVSAPESLPGGLLPSRSHQEAGAPAPGALDSPLPTKRIFFSPAPPTNAPVTPAASDPSPPSPRPEPTTLDSPRGELPPAMGMIALNRGPMAIHDAGSPWSSHDPGS